ncbi:hypothetical protein FACS1894111_12510 [Clostridia bacterium]|nr:hypothetical protein FACS1894111_12510 [Clostridia bacterium]
MKFDASELATLQNEVYKIQGIKPFTDKYAFYYDETNNCRKFRLDAEKNDGVNNAESLTHDFILGGVCFDVASTPQLNGIIDKIKPKQCNTEFKSAKHFPKVANCSDFIQFLKCDSVVSLLDWLDENEKIYIHYICLNNLYMSLVDIVDSCEHSEYFNRELKVSLYNAVKTNQIEFLRILNQYNYPDIKNDDVDNFSRELCDFISEVIDNDYNFHLEYLRQILKSSGKRGELVFIQNNNGLTLIDESEYISLYVNRIVTFPAVAHYLDKITTVENSFEKYENIPQYKFVDSKDEPFIQMSDGIIKVLSNLFYFLDTPYVLDFKDGFDKEQIRSMKIIRSLLMRSDNKSKLFIQNLSPDFAERFNILSEFCKQ